MTRELLENIIKYPVADPHYLVEMLLVPTFCLN